MSMRTMPRPFLATAAVALLATALAVWLASTSYAQTPLPFQSPIQSPSPTPQPALTPPPPPPTPLAQPSAESQIALGYVSEKQGLPVARLIIANQHTRQYPESGRTFRAFTVLDTVSGRFYSALVDMNDLSATDDLVAVEQAEADAQRAKYGALEPALYERLQRATDDELIPVAVWVAGKPSRSPQELFQAVAAQFPEAQAALVRSGKPFDVADPALRAKSER
jgi:hypothetical protein